MACKLVALYQQRLDDIANETQSMTMQTGDDLLPPQVVNEHIGKASKVLAKFSLENFGKPPAAVPREDPSIPQQILQNEEQPEIIEKPVAILSRDGGADQAAHQFGQQVHPAFGQQPQIAPATRQQPKDDFERLDESERLDDSRFHDSSSQNRAPATGDAAYGDQIDTGPE